MTTDTTPPGLTERLAATLRAMAAGPLPDPIGAGRSLMARLGRAVPGMGGAFAPTPNGSQRSGSRRRVAASNGRLHVEMRRVPPERMNAFVRTVRREAPKVDGIDWADVVPVLARVVVALTPGGDIAGDAVLDWIGELEDSHDAVEFDSDGREHPADIEPAIRTVTALAGDVVGLSLSVLGRARGATPLPRELDLAAMFSLVEGVRPLRRVVDSIVGPRAADVGLAVANAVAAGIAQSPLGPAVDIANRSLQLAEILARRAVWNRREPELVGDRGPTALRVAEQRPRVVPVPHGPIETYAERAFTASVVGFGAGLIASRSIERAGAALSAGLPKAARLGREAFCAQLARWLASRDVVTLEPDALRRLDRVDCVVLQAELVLSPDLALGEVASVSSVEAGEASRRAASLYDPSKPTAVRHSGGWSLGAVDQLGVALDARARRLAARMQETSAAVLGLAKSGRLVALVSLYRRLGQDGTALVQAVRDAGFELVIAGDARGATRLAGVQTIAGGAAMAEGVRGLQAAGHVVLVVAAGGATGLADADVGVGLRRPGDPVPWAASFVCGDTLEDALVVVQAAVAAGRVSRQSATIATAGASVAGLFALTVPAPLTVRRTMSAISLASAVSIGNGVRAASELARRPLPMTYDRTPYHSLTAREALAKLDSSFDGLTTPAAAERLRPPPARAPEALVLAQAVVGEVVNPLTPILVVGAGLSIAVGSVLDAAMVSGVVALNAVIGGVQKYRADRAVDALGRTGTRLVLVRRDGREELVDAASIVAGDVIRLRAGDAVPADCRVLQATALEVDESGLTGESVLVAKNADPCVSRTVADRACMLYDSTSVAAGEAVALVVATGSATEARRALAEAGQVPVTGVEARLQSLVSIAAPVSTLSGLGIVGSGLLRGFPLADVAAAGVSLAVAAVPEGLPLLATTAQLGAARRLAKRGALVRNPRAIEALGRVEVVCADKTGTLTEGRIALRLVSDGREEATVDALTDDMRRILSAGLRASPSANGGELPHPTDRALVNGARDNGATLEDGAPGWTRVDELPFEPSRGFHASLGRSGASHVLTVKGAPEVVIPACTTRGGRPMRATDRAKLVEEVDVLARRGLRVLAVAERSARGPKQGKRGGEDLANGAVSALDFLGFLAFTDPVRPSAAVAVDGLRRAGVEVVMITGDHPSTAEGIAAELGLLSEHGVLTGPELDEMTDEQLGEVVERVSVFARVTPAHKVRIVQAFQSAGKAVAMTGDGANDAPAIRLADVGIALGERSTAAAREAADLIVLDDRIETIVDAAVEGRALWASVRDSVATLVGGNLGEVAFTVLGSLVDGRPPLNARQLLAVNLLTDVAPAMAIALRPPRHTTPEALALEGPESSLGGALNRAIAIRAATTAAGAGGAWIAARFTGTRRRADTVALAALVGTQLVQTLATGGSDPVVLAAGLGSAAVLFGIVQTPGLSQLFGCTPLGPVGWATASASSVLAAGASTVATRAFGLRA